VPIIGTQGITGEPLQQPRAVFGAEQVMFMLECPPQGHDVSGRTMGQVREGTGVDLAVCPVGLAQKDATMCALARRRLGQDFCHIHDDYTRSFPSLVAPH